MQLQGSETVAQPPERVTTFKHNHLFFTVFICREILQQNSQSLRITPALSVIQVKTEPSLRTRTPELCPAIDIRQKKMKIQEWTAIPETALPREAAYSVSKQTLQIESKKARYEYLEDWILTINNTFIIRQMVTGSQYAYERNWWYLSSVVRLTHGTITLASNIPSIMVWPYLYWNTTCDAWNKPKHGKSLYRQMGLRIWT